MPNQSADNARKLRPRDSWDFAGMQKRKLSSLATSHISSYSVARSRPRTSDRERDLIDELVPPKELEQFMLGHAVLKNKLLLRMMRSRDLLMSILSTALLFASTIIFAVMQGTQSHNYNRKIPDQFYTAKYMWYRRLEQNLFLVYIALMAGYLVTFSLSVQWKLQIDAEIELAAQRRSELLHFSKDLEPKEDEPTEEAPL